MMVVEDCGEIPVCEYGTRKPIGVVTDRDIVCRTVAKGLNPLAIKVSACLSAPCVTVVQDMSVDEWAMYGQLTAKVLRASHAQRERAPERQTA